MSNLQMHCQPQAGAPQAGPQVRVNGRAEPLVDATVAALLARHDIGEETKGVAVAFNGAVLARAQWAATALNAGDRVEIVQARQGG